MLYLALEDGERLFQERVERIFNGRPSIPLWYETTWPRLNEGGLDRLDTWLRTHPSARLVVIDTLAKIQPTQDMRASAYQADYDAIAPIQALIAQRPGVACILNTHTRKADAMDVIDEVSGTSGRTGAVDSIWVLKRGRGESTAELHLTYRAGASGGVRELTFDQTQVGWVLGGDAHEARQNKVRSALLDALEDGAQYPRDLAELIEADRAQVRKQLQIAKRAGLVRQDDKGRYELLRRGSGDQGDHEDQGIRGSGPAPRRPRANAPMPEDHRDSAAVWRTVDFNADDTPTALPQMSANAVDLIPDPHDPHDPHDPLILDAHDLFAQVPPAQRVTIRLYLRSQQISDQRIAREQCQAAGIDYEAAWRAVTGSSAPLPDLDTE